MDNLASEIRKACENKIALLQQEIDRLREGMKIVIDALQGDDSGSRELDHLPAKVADNILTQQNYNQPIIKTDINAEPNTRERMLLAIEKMPLSGFGTSELFKTINNDGNAKAVNQNRALRVFNDLIKSGSIQVISKRVGNKGGVYSKHKEAATTESSPVIMQRTIFPADEKGQGE